MYLVGRVRGVVPCSRVEAHPPCGSFDIVLEEARVADEAAGVVRRPRTALRRW